jgi:uncharacterized protein (DUF433 family)
MARIKGCAGLCNGMRSAAGNGYSLPAFCFTILKLHFHTVIIDLRWEVNIMYIIDRIEVNREIIHGKPVVAGTRIPVYMIMGLLAEGISPEEIIKDYYPHLTKEDIMACLKYACTLSEEEEIYAR